MYVFSPMTPAAADEIDGWSYSAPYDFYDLDADPEDREAFLDPASWPDRTYAVREAVVADGTSEPALVGFFSFTPADGGEGGAEAVELGLGMAPDRTGQGDGASFVAAGVAFAQGKYDPDELALGVAAFNERAIRVYEAAGFEETGTFEQETNGGVFEFVGMRLSLS